MSHHDEDPSFFERERDRLSREITSGFEELLSSTNGLNRKLEEVLGMSKGYATTAALWRTFYELMRSSAAAQDAADVPGADPDATPDNSLLPAGGGLPGTGTHIVRGTGVHTGSTTTAPAQEGRRAPGMTD